MNSILVTGCNRGLGLGLVKALTQLPKPPQHLFATCRNLEQATELQELAQKNPNIHLLEIDLRNFNSYEKLVSEISSIVKDKGLNVLFNNAGISPKSTRITTVRENDLTETLLVNTVVPIMLSKACLPLLQRASAVNFDKPMGLERAAIVNMSSILGSIECNDTGAMYAYRTSKCGVNAATKSLSIDLNPDKVLCVCVHPGWVRTDMGGKKAPLDVQTSTTTMLETLLGFDEEQNGGFYQYDGKPLPW